MTKGVEAGKAFVTLGLKDETQRQLKAISNRLNKWSKQTAAAAAAIGVPLIAAAKTFASAGDQLQKMSLRTGVAVEALSELKFAAEQSGSDIDAVGKALFDLRRRVGEAATGSGEAAKTLEALGISAQELSSKSTADQFAILVDALRGVENESERAAFAYDLFGRQSRDLAPLLMEGGKGIEALRQEARELGIVMDTETANSAAALTDAINRVQRQFQQVVVEIGGAVAPALTALSHQLTPVISGIIEWVKNNEEFIVQAGQVAAALAGISLAAKGLSLLFAGSLNPFALMAAGAIEAARDIATLNDRLADTADKVRVVGKYTIGGSSIVELAAKQAVAQANAQRGGGGMVGAGGGSWEVEPVSKSPEVIAAAKKNNSELFKSVASRLSTSITSAVDTAVASVKSTATVAAAGMNLAANIGMAQIPNLSSFTAGGMGSQALAFQSVGGAGDPIRELADYGSQQVELLDVISENIAKLRARG